MMRNTQNFPKIRQTPVKIFDNYTRFRTFPASSAIFIYHQMWLNNDGIQVTDSQTYTALRAFFHPYQLICGIFKIRTRFIISRRIDRYVT
jgi:hypothetical protein